MKSKKWQHLIVLSFFSFPIAHFWPIDFANFQSLLWMQTLQSNGSLINFRWLRCHYNRNDGSDHTETGAMSELGNIHPIPNGFHSPMMVNTKWLNGWDLAWAHVSRSWDGNRMDVWQGQVLFSLYQIFFFFWYVSVLILKKNPHNFPTQVLTIFLLTGPLLFRDRRAKIFWWKVAETPIELYLWKRRFTQARRKVVVIRLPFDSENPAPIPSIQWEKLESRKRKI